MAVPIRPVLSEMFSPLVEKDRVEEKEGKDGQQTLHCLSELNPFASIGRTGTSYGKVKVMVICLNISFMT